MDNDDNDKLADACRSRGSKCCKSGTFLLKPWEYESIERWVAANGTAGDLRELHDRMSGMVYDQRQRCQFLDGRDLCRLHVYGVKPLECWFWPLHTAEDGDHVEVSVATCCDAHCSITAEMVDDVARVALCGAPSVHPPTELRSASLLLRRLRRGG